MTVFRTLRNFAKRIPLLSVLLRYVYRLFRKNSSFESSGEYWERRYKRNKDSGDGSYGRLAQFKAEIINDFVKENGIQSVIEFGCGDGAQLALMEYPKYAGIDVSNTIINKCRKKFAEDTSKTFWQLDEFSNPFRNYDLAVSLDVIYHLVEDEAFEHYMHQLFDASKDWVIIYSSDKAGSTPHKHVKHRQFSEWVRVKFPGWKLNDRIDQKYPFRSEEADRTSYSDFFIYKKISCEPTIAARPVSNLQKIS